MRSFGKGLVLLGLFCGFLPQQASSLALVSRRNHGAVSGHEKRMGKLEELQLPILEFLEQKKDPCACNFDNTCTCDSALAYMDCISNACASGECECSDVQYHNSCVDISNTCTELNFDCDLDKVTCEDTKAVTVDEKSPFCCPISPPPWEPREAHATKTSSCSCEFKDECTCASTLEYLDCISEICASGDCECSDVKYHNSCVDIANACGDALTFECEMDKATCTETVSAPASADFLAPQPNEEVLNTATKDPSHHNRTMRSSIQPPRSII